MLRHCKVKSSIIICKMGKTCIIQIIPSGSESQPQVSAVVKSLVFYILKSTHLRGSVMEGTRPDRPLSLPQVSVQHWGFGEETTGDSASGTCSVLSTPLLWPHSSTTGDEMYNRESTDGALHCPFLCVSTPLTGEFVKAFLAENGNYAKLGSHSVQQNTTLISMLLGMQ